MLGTIQFADSYCHAVGEAGTSFEERLADAIAAGEITIPVVALNPTRSALPTRYEKHECIPTRPINGFSHR